MPLGFFKRKSRRVADTTSHLLPSGTPSASVHETSRLVSVQSSNEITVPITDNAPNVSEASVASVATIPQDGASAARMEATTSITPHHDAAMNSQDDGELRNKLWLKAFKLLEERDSELVEDYMKHLRDGNDADADGAVLSKPDNVKAAISELLTSREDKQWKIHLAGRKIQVREQVDNLVRLLSFSDKIVKDALSAQPYAALAWSGVSMFLPVSVSYRRYPDPVLTFCVAHLSRCKAAHHDDSRFRHHRCRTSVLAGLGRQQPLFSSSKVLLGFNRTVERAVLTYSRVPSAGNLPPFRQAT